MGQSRNDQENPAQKNHREKVKKYLERAFTLNAGILSAQEQIREYQSRSYHISSPSDFSGPRVQHSPLLMLWRRRLILKPVYKKSWMN